MSHWNHFKVTCLLSTTLMLVAYSYSTYAADNAMLAHSLDSLQAQMELLNRMPQNDSVRLQQAKTWRIYALTAQKVGLTEEAQEYALKAQKTFLDLHKDSWASLCLYERCIAYNSIGDTTHLRELLGELKNLALRDTDALTRYNYYSILHAYAMMEEDVRQALSAGRASVSEVEKIDAPEQYNIMPVWTYYNMALTFDLLFEPPCVDSIEHYLALAEQATSREHLLLDRQEARISIGDERAWLYFYRKEYELAERQMKQVLLLLDSVQALSPATIITEQGEAYAFFVQLYEHTGRDKEALAFQKRLTENNKIRYDIERQRVLDDIQTRYEVSEQQLELERQRRINGWIIAGLVIAALIVLVTLSLLLAALYRKREQEETLYALALEADNTHGEPLELLREQLFTQISELSDKCPFKSTALLRIQNLNIETFKTLIASANQLTNMDKRYLMCFAAGMTPEQVADIFLISPASVYTVRYRIKKKNPGLGDFL